MKKLIDRFDMGQVPRPKIWFNYGDYSILNCGELIKTHPFPEGLFDGWEALKDGEIIRAEDWEELEKIINPPCP